MIDAERTLLQQYAQKTAKAAYDHYAEDLRALIKLAGPFDLPQMPVFPVDAITMNALLEGVDVLLRSARSGKPRQETVAEGKTPPIQKKELRTWLRLNSPHELRCWLRNNRSAVCDGGSKQKVKLVLSQLDASECLLIQDGMRASGR
jgi:hypothetical protein